MRSCKSIGLLVVALATGCIYPKMNDLPDDEADAGGASGGNTGRSSLATHQGGSATENSTLRGGNSGSGGTSAIGGAGVPLGGSAGAAGSSYDGGSQGIGGAPAAGGTPSAGGVG